MTSLMNVNGALFAYEFDGEGNRIRQSLNDCLFTQFVYDGPDVVLELNAENEMAWAYVNGLEIDHPIERIGFLNGVSRQRQVYHTDALGSVVAISDESGAVIQRYSYDAFGAIHSQTGNTLNRITYTGREALGDSLGFYYYRNRTMDPTTGRFTSEDPRGFIDGPNVYVYVKNNAIRYIDSFGLQSLGELFRCLDKNRGDPVWDDLEIPSAGQRKYSDPFVSCALAGGSGLGTAISKIGISIFCPVACGLLDAILNYGSTEVIGIFVPE